MRCWAVGFCGMTAVIVMPCDIHASKQAAVRQIGADIVFYDRDMQDNADVVASVVAQTDRIEAPPSAHPRIQAGARTTALERLVDAIMIPISGQMKFDINRDWLAGGVIATDGNVCRAKRFAYDHFKIVAELGAAVGFAAILTGQVPIAGRSLATVITGGNIAPARFAALLEPRA